MKKTDLDHETALKIYKKAALLLANDERARKLIRSGQLPMVYYSYRGQEIIPAALCSVLNNDDYLCTIYRGIHDMLAKGFDLKLLWAELAGRTTGSCKGKGGPMHLTQPETGVMVTTGIVGSSMPIANGLAWGAQINGDNRVAVATFGDGASNIGAFHESLNMASVWKLPVIFVCQNNLFAEHTAYEAGTAVSEVAKRAQAYEMPGVRVDGNDPAAMYAAAKEAVDRARSGEGPTLIEAVTFRFFGHVFGDDDSYILKEMKEAAMANDPLPKFRQQLIDAGMASNETLEAIEAKIEKQIDEAVDFALQSPWPEPDALRQNVYDYEVQS